MSKHFSILSSSNEAIIRVFWSRFVSYIHLPWLVFFVILPWLIALALWIPTLISSQGRYDSSYFTPELMAQYTDPRESVQVIAESIRQGRSSQQAELQGRLNPLPQPTRPNLAYLFPYAYFQGYQRILTYDEPQSWLSMAGSDVRFAQYLYADRDSGDMLLITVEQVGGRWVYVPDSPYLYMQSGTWWRTWRTVAVLYYLVVILRVTWVYIKSNNRTHFLQKLKESGVDENLVLID